ncbi:MAG: thiamine-phosphate synthase family protein [Candidatus Ranarchaeia archaeon]
MSYSVVAQIEKGIKKLEDVNETAWILPEVGSNIAYLPKNATTSQEVVGLTGRIIRVGKRAKACGKIDRGGSVFIGRSLLVAHNIDDSIRAAISLKSSPAIIKCIKERKLNIHPQEEKYSYKKEKPSLHTIRTKCYAPTLLHELGFVPNILNVPGGYSIEPILIIFGQTVDKIVSQFILVAEDYMKTKECKEYIAWLDGD